MVTSFLGYDMVVWTGILLALLLYSTLLAAVLRKRKPLLINYHIKLGFLTVTIATIHGMLALLKYLYGILV